MKKIKDIKGTQVPTLLCIAFILIFGVLAVVFGSGIPAKAVQYNVRKNLIENGKIVDAGFDKYWIEENPGAPNLWCYMIRFCYVEDDVNYSITFQSGRTTEIEGLENKIVKILIDGKGNCIEADTTMGNLFTDVLLYVLLWLFFTIVTITFTTFAIINVIGFTNRRKLKKSEKQNNVQEN